MLRKVIYCLVKNGKDLGGVFSEWHICFKINIILILLGEGEYEE